MLRPLPVNTAAILLPVIILMIVPFFALHAQEDDETEAENRRTIGNFWLGFGGDTALYSQHGYAYGGSFTFGYGAGSAIGVKASCYFNEEGIDTVELNFLLRFYFLRMAYKGPFFQLMGGPALFNRTGDFTIPSNSGMLSAGLCLGWRFVLAERFYIEPAVRGGYPYLLGATVSAGVRL